MTPTSTPKCEAHSGLSARIDNLEHSNEELWTAIDTIRNRPPVWCTVIISILMFGMGFVVAMKVT